MNNSKPPFFVPHLPHETDDKEEQFQGGVILEDPVIISKEGERLAWSNIKVIGNRDILEFLVPVNLLKELGQLDRYNPSRFGVTIARLGKEEIQFLGQSKRYYGLNATELGLPTTFEMIGGCDGLSIHLRLDAHLYYQALDQLMGMAAFMLSTA